MKQSGRTPWRAASLCCGAKGSFAGLTANVPAAVEIKNKIQITICGTHT